MIDLTKIRLLIGKSIYDKGYYVYYRDTRNQKIPWGPHGNFSQHLFTWGILYFQHKENAIRLIRETFNNNKRIGSKK